MWGVTDLGTYVVGLVLIVLLPGPNSLFVLSVAARDGVRRGYAAAAGVFTGDAVLMVLSAAGVASVLKTNEVLFGIVKYLGAGYLGWLAIGLLRAAWATWRSRHERVVALAPDLEPEGVAGPAALDRGLATAYRRALIISLLNPKAILFFIAFFVQFVDPDYAYPALSFLVLGTLAEIASLLYLSTLILCGARLAAAMRRRRVLSATGTTAVGVVFLGFAVKLATASA
ncbi:leucine efflux protein LeuE [Nocardioides sp.]|uniref:leucine efflux protein LeuE n=1 Tax=Nocardioides sp. TaxID=35761 RepID=UPI0035149563